ncbi:N-6 DNA methylase [Enterococcus sp. AZ012]|uniref:N-6 DNA methylase n=1 Tax=unclassified Enterococcus TaxID=2608891 RepID=UPI003D2BDD39
MDIKKKITTNLLSIAGKHSINKVFSDWIRIMAYALSNTADHQNFQERESLYLETIHRYEKHQAFTFKECYFLLTDALEKDTIDWLGEIYMDLNLANKSMGQCFTPNDISKLMAELTFPSMQKDIETNGHVNYYEPCCGSGSMIIGLASVMKSKGYNMQNQLLVLCEDLDETCLLMTYVQLSILGIRAKCQVKNSLSNEVFSTWYTPYVFIH